MKKLMFVLLLLTGPAFGTEHAEYFLATSPNPIPIPSFTFMVVHAVDHGATVNEKFFLGPLPHPGDVVEMVYTGSDADGAMLIQLRTRPWWKFW